MEQEAPAGWEFFDSVDFPTDHIDDPMGRPRVRHVVTAVVVGHEGAAWLPRLSEALWGKRDEDDYCLERFGRRPVDQFAEVGWLTPRAWVAHCIYPDASEITRLGAAGVGVAHCPSSNLILGNGRICPVRDLRAAGTPVGRSRS